MPERFWSDTFDMDLPRIIPGLDETLGTAADIPLWTHGGTSHGRLNHPSVWNSHIGLVAFFGTSPDRVKPGEYYTFDPVVEATWREVLRDAWVHTYLVLVDDVPVWDTTRLSRTFVRLMYGLRGWAPLPDREADRLRGKVLASVSAATRQLTAHVQAVTR